MGDLPLIGLVCLLKNEAASVTALLESVRDVVDKIVLLDTGSTDGTQELARQAADQIPFELYEEPFLDFGRSRNRALELLGTSTRYSLMLSGDEVVKNPAALRAFCKARVSEKIGAYYLALQLGSLVFDSARLARTANGWRYVGAAHEVLCHPTEPVPLVRVPGCLIVHDRRGATADSMAATWRRHLQVLGAEHAADPTKARTVFYLAQTHKCLGEHEEAIAWYQKRIAMGGWGPEIYEALFAIAQLRHQLDHPWPEVERAYLKAYSFHPCRAEPLWEIANRYRMKDDWPACYTFARMAEALPMPTENALFLETSVYTWQAADTLAIACYYLGHHAEGRRAAEKALRARPQDERLKKNLSFFTAP